MSLKLLHPSDISCLSISTEVEIFVVHHKLQFSTSVEPVSGCVYIRELERTALTFFLLFCMELGIDKPKRVTELDF